MRMFDLGTNRWPTERLIPEVSMIEFKQTNLQLTYGSSNTAWQGEELFARFGSRPNSCSDNCVVCWTQAIFQVTSLH